jgi:hypothetical protein
MKNAYVTVMLNLVLLSSLSSFSSASNTVAPPIPGVLSNARFVYVAAYDGDQFDARLLPEDRAAIARVQDAIQKWGKLTVVYRLEVADVVLMVQSRGSEDVLAVYDAHSGDRHSGPSSTYLWRVMGRGGLQSNEMPLFTQFETAWDKAAK